MFISSPQDLLKATAEKAGWSGPHSSGGISRPPDGQAHLPASVSRARFAGNSGRSRHARTGYGRGSYGSRAWRGGFRQSGRSTGFRSICPVDAAGRFYRAEGAPGELPERADRQDGLGRQPHRDRHSARTPARWLARENFEHSYPHCWRCHNPTIFRATDQWFIGMERNDLRAARAEGDFRSEMEAQRGAKSASRNMIATRPDWCISRQRVWGVPIIGVLLRSVPASR